MNEEKTKKRIYNNTSIESHDKIRVPYNKDLSKTGGIKNINLTSNNLFEEENIDSKNFIKDQDDRKSTLNDNEDVKRELIIPGNWGIEQNDQNSEIPETVIINKALIMSTVNVAAMKIKSNGKYLETDIASRTHAIQVNFKLSKNSFSTKGNKEVYIVIQNPKGKVINEKGNFMMKNGQEMPYTDQTVTYYHKTNLDVTIMSERFIQKIVKGTYIVKIYIEGELIGMTLLILRG